MPTTFAEIKVNIPGVGERAYVFANYRLDLGQCTPNPFNTARACMYIFSHVGQPDNGAWLPGGPFENLFPTVGEYLVIQQTNTQGAAYVFCYKVLEIIDEATFLTGTCTSCYNNGHAGDCSDVFISAPPLPGDPNGCLYDNSINPAGVDPTSTNWLNNEAIGYTHDAWISNNCVDCTAGTPPVFEPNMVVNCCDPTETYIITPGPPYFSTVLNDITGTSVGQLGVTNFTQAFIADLYIGGAQTGDQCWHLKEDYPPFGPMAFTATFASVAFPNCTALNLIINNICCGPPPPPPPLYEWCCMTGVAGPAGQSTCTQVLVGTCQPGTTNYSSGPFITLADCQNNPCGTPVMNGIRSCCDPTIQYTVDPAYPLNKQVGEAFWGSFSIWVNNVEIFPGFGCWVAIDDAVGPMMGNGAFGPPYPDCQSIVFPLSPPSHTGPCCPNDIGCEPPFVKLAKLTSKLDKFTAWKDKSLGK